MRSCDESSLAIETVALQQRRGALPDRTRRPPRQRRADRRDRPHRRRLVTIEVDRPPDNDKDFDDAYPRI
jgi:hypothetical protein